MRNKAQKRQQAIAAIKSAVRNGRLKFVSDPHSPVPGRFWIETRYYRTNDQR